MPQQSLGTAPLTVVLNWRDALVGRTINGSR